MPETLVSQLMLFGSLAADSPADAVHDASDIDLAIVKATKLRFMDRIRGVLDLIQPRVGVNVLVYTPDEIEQAGQQGPAFLRDEILAKGKPIFPRHG
jgi:predicted nucleotidyltransferase